ncbi:MAG: hypothetical protein COZ06_32600 [Armatimonadetes bacterium CG_4_10_14_3_um_filter_66_18]|nr:hypothetical protein [Armatimonadota bacterium]OIO95391.1 MAG: hypothetical protein AUJ96_26820 [Armatimonadetes bacterium CG2_30_66_41]PIU91851.1 MAG: hypothetical protein COS65_20500 [Armatimonadetes bacterium CG06_land_8_20_14_3_00_66_21]PIW13431.1 MAG: hypothetical protein COW34_09545 [Armatimonadetes bacterium CG17_big_fil_post_rev_8_21_14_2_50_66_6]PIX46779.1 MAG: hypothetical protein COZ57_10290 [Armatimonadetes bacterium CG_4_8_14_3_um_filter_66_20]PIY37579.1 MAG: hypothetical prote
MRRISLYLASALALTASGHRAWGEDSLQLRGRCLALLRAGLQAEEFWPSMHAAEALTQTGHGDEVLAALKGRLDTETDDQHRCGLAREQVRAGKTECAEVMLSILGNKESNGRVHAAESLYKVRQTGDGKLLRAALEEGDPALEAMATAALIRGGDSALLTRLRGSLASKDDRPRQLAAWILGRLGDKTDWPALQKLAETETDPLTRSYDWNALAQLKAPGALAQVLRNLKSEDAGIRTYAAQTVGDCRATDHTQDLVPLLDDPNLDTRIRAAQSILLIAAAK